MNGFSDLKKKAESGGNNQQYEDYPYVNIKPESVVAFDAITDMRFFGDISDDDGNPLELTPQQTYKGNPTSGDLILTITNPTTVEGKGQLYAAQGRTPDEVARKDDAVDEYVDYMLIDPDADGFDESFDQDGTLTGVVPRKGANKYAGEEVDGFDEDTVTIFIKGQSAYDVARALDVNGSPITPIDEDGRRTNGLLENKDDYDGDVDDVYRRITRYPQLRALEWEENDGGFLFMYRNGQGYEADLYFNDWDDSVTEATQITPTFNPDGVEFDSVYYWHEQPPEAGSTQIDLGDVETDSEWADGLDDVETEFVESFVDAADLNPDREPVMACYGGNWEKWAEVVENNIGDDVAVTDDLTETLNEACKECATAQKGE